jgi:hypothetical protein
MPGSNIMGAGEPTDAAEEREAFMANLGLESGAGNAGACRRRRKPISPVIYGADLAARVYAYHGGNGAGYTDTMASKFRSGRGRTRGGSMRVRIQ